MEISKEKILENINLDIPFDLNGLNKEFYLEFDKFVDLICDVSINSVAPLSEKETYVLRKRLGVFDNGNIQSLRVVGMIDIRHHINHPVLSTIGGHIGYSIRPSERGKGIGTEMLKKALVKCKASFG